EHGEVVELPDHRDEVRYEVDREHQVRGDTGEYGLLLQRYARIASEPPDQPRVGRELACGLDHLAHGARTLHAFSHREPPPAGTVPAAPRRPRSLPPRG